MSNIQLVAFEGISQTDSHRKSYREVRGEGDP